MRSAVSDRFVPHRRRVLAAGLLASALLIGPVACTRRRDPRPLLAGVARALFPYAFLGDAAYRAIVAAIVPAAPPPGADAALAALERDGAWRDQDAATRHRAIERFLATPFGAVFRAGVLVGLYHDLAIVRRFGYPGPSIAFGGYLQHGVGDIDWLPKPDQAAHG